MGEWENNLMDVYDILKTGTDKARKKSDETFARVKKAMKMDYFADKDKMVAEWKEYIAK